MIKDYFQKSESPFYSFIITLPMFLLYELGLFLMRGTEFSYIKNGADVLIEEVISTLGFDIFYISSSLFLLVFFIPCVCAVVGGFRCCCRWWIFCANVWRACTHGCACAVLCSCVCSCSVSCA